jgi:hypothetical protein
MRRGDLAALPLKVGSGRAWLEQRRAGYAKITLDLSLSSVPRVTELVSGRATIRGSCRACAPPTPVRSPIGPPR